MILENDFVFTDNFKQAEGFYYTVIENQALGINSTTDLIPGVYEGGLKLWECSIDLVKYLKTLPAIPEKVIELGCGHGIPGIYCAQQGSSVSFQDFNREVVQHVTANNVQKNSVFPNSRFYYGPWGDISSCGIFDLVLTSETIYNPSNYNDLLTAIRSTGAPVCFVACKKYYFGVGGGAELFMASATAFGFFCEVVRKIDEIASTRYILKLTNI